MVLRNICTDPALPNMAVWAEGGGSAGANPWTGNMLGASLPGVVGFTRASGAAKFTSGGVLLSVGTDSARLDYHPTTLAARGLLLEGSFTNLLLWCRDLTNAAWSKTNITTSQTATGVDGSANTATIVTASSANGTVLQSVTSASASRVASAYVKRRTGSGVVQMTMDGGTTWATITVTGSWARVALTAATITNPQVGFKLATSGDAIDVDAVQLENGSFASSAILTTTASATRAVDLANVTSLVTNIGFNPSEGTFVVEAETGNAPTVSGNGKRYVQFDDGTDNNVIAVTVSNATSQIVTGMITNGGSSTSSSNGPTLSVGDLTKVAMAYKSGDNNIAVNGTLLGGAGFTGLATIPTITTLRIGNNAAATRAWGGWIRKVVYYPTRLSNSQLQSLTT